MGLKLIGEVALDGSGFEAGLNKLERGAERVGETLKGLALAAFGIYGIESALHSTIETADRLVDTSRRLGVSLEALQELGYAARQNGADIDKLTTFIEKLNSTRIDPKKVESFAKLGISQPDLSGLKVEDLIMKLSVNLRNRSSQEVIGPLRDIGGKGAGEMLVMLKDNLQELAEQSRNLGQMSTQTAVTLKFLADEMTDLRQMGINALALEIGKLTGFILHSINALRAGATFFAEIGKNLSFRDLLKSFIHPFSKDSKVEGAISNAALSAATQLALLNTETDRKMDALVTKQKQAEEINRIPDFTKVTPEVTTKEAHSKFAQIHSDSLSRVGNFLGSARGSANPLISIGHTTNTLLRQISHNTQWRPIAGHGGHGFPPH